MIQTIFKVFLGLVLAALALALLVGFMSPAEWRAEAEQKIERPISEVFQRVNTPNTWPSWTVWNTQTYPSLEISYAGPEAGVGARQQWFDGAMHGEMAITESRPNQYVGYTLDMDQGEFTMDCAFVLTDGHAVTVNWACWGDSGGNPVARLMMRFYSSMMRNDFNAGLNTLKAQLEGA